jgi:hypothetical protein
MLRMVVLTISVSDSFPTLEHCRFISEICHRAVVTYATSTAVLLLPSSTYFSHPTTATTATQPSTEFSVQALGTLSIMVLAESACTSSVRTISRFSSRQILLTPLHLRNRCPPSSSSLPQMQHFVSIFTPHLCRFLLTANVL